MKIYKTLIVFICILINFVRANEFLHREKRQIFYEDIQFIPKSFRPRGEEKDEVAVTTDAEETTNVKTNIAPLTIYQLFASSNSKPPPAESTFKKPEGSPFKQPGGSFFEPPNLFEDDSIPITSFGESFHAKPSNPKPKPAFKDPLKPKPKPAYEEPYHPRPTFQNEFNHKPKPAYEESYQPRPFFETEKFFSDGLGARRSQPRYKPTSEFDSAHVASAQISKPIHHDEYKEKKNPIPGIPGQDYPIYNEIPSTSFTCEGVPFRPGMYANPETGCQVYHVCHDNRHGHQGAAFLCGNGTVFNQETFNCDWWYNVDCSKATSLYELNSDPEFNPYYKKPVEVVYIKEKEELGYKNNDLLQKRESSVQLLRPLMTANAVQLGHEPHSPPTFRETEGPKPPAAFASSFSSYVPRANPLHQTRIKSNLVKSQNPFANHPDSRKEFEKTSKIISNQPHNQNRRIFEVEENDEQSKTIVRKFENKNTAKTVDRTSTTATEKDGDNSSAVFKRPSETFSSSSGKRIIKRKRLRPNKAAPKVKTSESIPSEDTALFSHIKRQNVPKAQFRNTEETINEEQAVADDVILDFEWGQRTT